MRVAIFASGLSYHAARWANALADRGLDIAYVTHHAHVTRPLRDEIEVYSVGSGYKFDYILGARRARRFLRTWRADIAHSHYATGYGMLGTLSGWHPLVVSIYGADIYDFPRRGSLEKRLLGFILDRADVLLSTSETMADRLLSEFPHLVRPEVTPFGVDTRRFSPTPAATASDRFRVGVVKRLKVKYGIDVLIEACALFNDMGPAPALELQIVGEGSERSALRALAERLGVAAQVHFVGALENDAVPSFLHGLDAYAVPSRHDSESFGVAAVEAQACALPVVASRVGGLPEVVDDGITGLIVPREAPRELAAALHRLALDGGMRRRMGEAGRRRVLEHYDWDDNLAQMIRVYERAVR